MIIITAPSLNPDENVSGISSVARFVIENNHQDNYLHFQIGKKDNEDGKILHVLLNTISRYRSWKKFLKHHSDALIHYSYPLSGKSIVRDFFFMDYAHRHHRKMVIHLHGGIYLNQLSIPALMRTILQHVFSWGCPIIVLSDEEKTKIESMFSAKNVYVLPNSVDIPSREDSERNFVKLKEFHLLYLGRIEVNKGMDYLLEACKKLKDKGLPFVLHMAGKEEVSNQYVPRFEEALGPHFIYEGVVTGERKSELLKKCDIFVLPSFFEGLPMSLLECMSYGMIPVTTSVGSIPSVVNDNNGCLIPLKNYDTIVDSLSFLLKDRTYAQQLSDNAAKTIRDKFSPNDYIEGLNKIYTLC